MEPSPIVDTSTGMLCPFERKKKYTKYGTRRTRERNPRKNGASFSGILSEKMKEKISEMRRRINICTSKMDGTKKLAKNTPRRVR